MSFAEPPSVAGWRHHDARVGAETVRVIRLGAGWRLRGATSALERGPDTDYAIDVDERWRTLRARVSRPFGADSSAVTVEQPEPGRWLVDGRADPVLDGCLDVDLEASAMTNALPVHRLRLDVGEGADVPAVYVRVADLAVERLEQTYVRLPDDGERRCYEYTAPAFAFTARLVYDASGFVLEYPGVADRTA